MYNARVSSKDRSWPRWRVTSASNASNRTQCDGSGQSCGEEGPGECQGLKGKTGGETDAKEEDQT